MRVLVTGASGFVGAEVVRALLAGGHEVGAMASPGSAAERLQDMGDQMTLLRGDLYEEASLRQMIAAWPPEVCIHLAWYVEPGQYLKSMRNTEALAASLRLIQLLGEAGCRRFVGCGTCFEYDVERGWLHEDGPTRPETIYAASKLSLGLVGAQVAAGMGMQFAWGRLFYLHGPREDPRRVVPALISSLQDGKPFPATSGEQVRDYLYLDDAAAAFAALAQTESKGVFNVSSGVPITMAHLLQTTAQIMGRTELLQLGAVPPRPFEPRFICGDNSRLRGLGWAPRFTLEEGLRATVDWWKRP